MISTCISFSLKLICTDESSVSKILFYLGLLFNITFQLIVLFPNRLKIYTPFLLSSLYIFIVLAINSHLQNRTDKISFITRITFWLTCPLLISILFLKLSEPIYFTILSSLVIFGTSSYLISSLLINDLKGK